MAEIIIVTAIVGIGAAVFFRFWYSRTSAETSITNRLTLQIDARKAADVMIARLREASEVLRPTLGESLSYVTFLDAVNRAGMLYPTRDEESSKKFKRDLLQIIHHASEANGAPPSRQNIIARAVKRLAFTLTAPNSIQISVTVANEKEEYQLLTEVGLMNFGANQ